MRINGTKIILLLFILLLPVLDTACQTSKVNQDTNFHLRENIISMEDDSNTNILDATVNNNAAYFIDQNNIIKYNLVSDERSVIVEATGNIAICTDKEFIYTYNHDQNAVIKYDNTGKVINSYSCSFDPIQAVRMKKFGNTIIIVAQFINKTEYPEHELYKLDLSSGESSKISDGFKGKDSYSFIVGLDFENENTIMISSIVTTSMMNMVVKGYRFDLQKEKVVEDFILPYSIAYSYDTESACFYYVDSGLIKGYDTKSTAIVTLSKVDYSVTGSLLSSKYAFDRLFYIRDNVILWNKVTNNIIVADMSSDKDPLKVMISDTLSSNFNIIPIMDQFEAETGCPVHLIEYTQDVYCEKLRLKLLATENDFDICMIDDPTKDNLLSSILSHDLFEPLNNYDEIVSNFSQMYKGIDAMMSHDNKLYGIPYRIMDFSLMDIKSDLTQFGYANIGKHWTNDDLWKLCDELIKSSEQNVSVFIDPSEITRLITIFIQDSIDKNNLDKAALINLLANIKNYCDAGVFTDLSFYNDNSGFKKDLLTNSTVFFTPFMFDVNVPDYPKYGTVIYPTYGEKNYLYLQGCALINKFSANKEMAAKFIEVMTRSENIYNTDIYNFTLLGPELTKYNIYNQWSANDLLYLGDVSSLYENAGVFTFDSLSIWNYFDENKIKSFYNGSISVEEAAELIYDRVNYTYFE